MRRAAALLAALALLLLPGCGQSGAGWEGPGECYAAEVPELPGEFEPELYCYYGSEGYRLAIASGGGLSVLSPGKLLFRLSGSGGGLLRVDENGAWLYCLDGEGVYLRLYSMEGELLAEAVLPAEPQGLLLSRGRAWADLGERAVSLSPDGRTEELELPEGHRYLVADGDGGLHSVSVQGAGLFVLPLDGGIEGFAVEGGVLGSGDEAAFLYLAGTDGVYTLDAAGARMPLVDFDACRIEPGRINALSPLGEGRLLCSTERGYVLLRPATPEEVADRAVLTLGVFGYSSRFEALVWEYNSSGGPCLIRVVDYYELAGGSLENARTRLAAEFAAGEGPDMLCVGTVGGSHDPGLAGYIARGLMADMTPYLDADPELGREDLMVWDALCSPGGLYVLSDGFTLRGLRGPKEVFGERRGISIAEYLEMEAALELWQDMAYHMEPGYFIEELSKRYLAGAVDRDAGACDFNNAEFISILEAALLVRRDRSDEYETPENFENAWQRMGRGQLMLGAGVLSGLGRGLKFDEAWSGREMSYFGFISPDGETGLSVVLDWALGICAASEHKEACWDFISYLLTDAPEGLATHSLPLYRPAFEQMLRDGIGDSPFQLRDEQEAEEYLALVESADWLEFYDRQALDIITEEASAYIAGARTAEETARVIQDRLSVYFAEAE